MSKVLVIDEALPHPPDSGKRIRTFELTRRMARSHEVTLAYHDEGDTQVEAVEATRAVGIGPLAVRRKRLIKRGLPFAWDLGRNLFLSVPYMVMAHRTRAMQETVRRLVKEQGIELIHVEWTPLLANVPEDLDVPVVVSAHNVEADIWRRYHENETRRLHRAYIYRQYKKVERYERYAFGRADAVTAVSGHDAERIREMAPDTEVVTVENGVDPTYFAPDTEAQVRPHEMVFVGSLDWRPNIDAVHFVFDAVWPRIREAVPDATFSIVGRNPSPELVAKGQAQAGVTVHGSVPDVRPFVREAAISVVPLRIGGGSRLKICEALAMRRPVISTTIGAEGLELGDGITRVDGATAFADAVIAGFREPERLRAEAERGYERALSRYAWDALAPKQDACWRRVLGETDPEATIRA